MTSRRSGQVIAGANRPGRPLISEEERKVQFSRIKALGYARDAARHLSLGLRLLQGGDPDEKSLFTVDVKGLGKLARELKRNGISRDQLLREIQKTYRQSAHPPSVDEAFDLARAFADSLPGFAEEEASPAS